MVVAKAYSGQGCEEEVNGGDALLSDAHLLNIKFVQEVVFSLRVALIHVMSYGQVDVVKNAQEEGHHGDYNEQSDGVES